jgi:AraC-like DNA-binding protein
VVNATKIALAMIAVLQKRETRFDMTQLQARQDRPKGVINPREAEKFFRLERYLPAPDLAPFVEHFWLVAWRLAPGITHLQRTLPYPCVNLVFDQGRTALFGVMTGSTPFSYTLQGDGRVLGVRFRAGGFRGFLGRPLHTITDLVLPMAPLFDCDVHEVESRVLGAADDAAMVAQASAVLRAALPPSDPLSARVDQLIATIGAQQSITQVQQLAGHAGISVRRLQMLFRDYVGVGPKWVIRRSRLHDAADQLANGSEVDLASLAQALGYFDQAHFTTDFEQLVGQPPAHYRRACRK